MLPFPRISTYGNTIPTINDLKSMATNDDSIFILTNGGNLYARGNNSNGKLGTGNTTAITTAWTLTNTNVSSVWANAETTLIRKLDGSWWITGLQRIFNNAASTGGVWTDISSAFSAITNTVSKVTLSTSNVGVIDSAGQLFTSGFNTAGQLGTGNTTNASVLTLRSDVGTVLDAQFTPQSSNTFYVLKSDGTLIGAGASAVGQLLQTTDSTTFKTLTTGVTSIRAGNLCFFCVKSDGTYVGGSQFNGQLGDGVNGSAIGTVGRTTLFKLTTVGAATEIYSRSYYTHLLYNGVWYVCGSNGFKAGAGSNLAQSGNFTSISSAIVPTLKSGTEWLHGTNNSYILSSDLKLYGCGTYASGTNLIPNFTTSQSTLVQLNTTI